MGWGEMTNDECWTTNDGGEGEIGEKYQEMAKDRNEDTPPKGLTSRVEMHAVDRGNDQISLLPRSGVSAKDALSRIIHESRSAGFRPVSGGDR